MASTYTDLGIELMATGENAGTWGTKTNNNLNLIEQLTGGFATLSIAGGAGTQALDIDDGALTGTAQQRVIEFTGSISGNRIITIPNDVETFYILKNSTTGANTVQFKYATGSGSSTTFSATDKGTKIVYASASPDATNPNIVDVMASSSEIVLANNNPIKFNDADNSAFVGIDAPATVSGSYTLTLPAADGSSGQVLETNGSGVLSFSTPSSGITTGKAIAMAMIFG